MAAVLADTVMARLQEFVIDYRTTKARQDLKYIETLNEEAKATYYKAQQNYAAYLDRNQNLSLFSAQTTRDRLRVTNTHTRTHIHTKPTYLIYTLYTHTHPICHIDTHQTHIHT